MSGYLLKSSVNVAGDPCTIENSQTNICSPDKLFGRNLATGEPGVDEHVINSDKNYEGKSTENELSQGIQKQSTDHDNYQKKLSETEQQLEYLQTTDNNNSSVLLNNEISFRHELEDVKKNLFQAELKLQERNRLIANQENQINALTKQVSSLKEVVAITKNLLEIRNAEVKHLQEDVDNMETKISAERSRHDLMISKMNATVRLNADLKTEYETQLRLFQDLRGKYQEKVKLLSTENKAMEMADIPKIE